MMFVFFQAEDGIRDIGVTGVQTCALPIWIDYFVWAAFVVEYLVKLYLAPSRRRFITHHLIDLAIVVLPLLRPLRILRLLRLLNFARVGVVLAHALKRARAIFTHRGLHFVLLAV